MPPSEKREPWQGQSHECSCLFRLRAQPRWGHLFAVGVTSPPTALIPFTKSCFLIILRDGENSLFIPGDGEEACARAIRRALALFPQGFPELSRAARRCVEQKFDYHVWAPTLRAMIEQTAGRGAQRNEGGGCDAGKHHHGRV